MIRLLFVPLFFLYFTASWATPQVETKRGNKAAGEGKSDDALIHYKQALEQKGDSSVILYDLGNLMYQGGEYESAEKSFLGSLNPKSPVSEQAAAFYNLGNTYFQGKQYDKAAQAYVESLKRAPQDDSTKYNLELARRMLQQQKQQQQQDQQSKDQEQKDKQQQDQQKSDQNKEQEQKQQQQDQQQKDQQQQQNQQQQDSSQQQPAQQQPQSGKRMSPQEAERILNALLQNEQDALKQAKKVKVQSRAKREKDW